MASGDPTAHQGALRRRIALGIAIAGGAGLAVLLGLSAITPVPPSGDVTTRLIVAGVLGLVASIGVFWLAAERLFVRPLGALSAELRFFTESARDAEIEPGRYPGLAPLPQLINALTHRLAASRQETERSVAAATRRAQEQKDLLEVILRDLSEGVLVCSLDHRILLYNQAAQSLLNVAGEIGLGRSLFNMLTSEPVLHMLDRLTHRESGEWDDDANAPLVCATIDSRALLRGRMMLIRGGDRAPTGYILTLTDVTGDIAELNRRDRLLREATTGLRAPLANLRAAAETLGAFPDIDPGQRRQFEQVMLRESEALARHVEMIDRESRDLAATQWSFADIHSVDLLNCVIRRMADAGGPAVTMIGLPLWLHGDSHALVVAFEHLASKLAAVTGCRQLDVEALLGDRRVYLEIAWEGKPVPEATIDSWLAEPLPEALGGPTLGDVLARHGSEIWSRPQPAGHGMPPRAVLRLPLPAPTRAQFQPPAAPRPARPEFYDFELMHLASADGGLAARALRSVPYVVFDSETTGLNPSQGDELISIGAVRIVNGRILTGETFARLINPARTIPRESIRFHNITDAMVADAPPAAVVLPQFRTFVGDAVLVAHNAAFDLKFIKLKEQDSGARFDMMALDTMLISAFLYPELGAHDFDAIAQRLGVEIAGRHTALGDALATAGVFLRLLDLLETRGITTLGDLMKASNMALAIRARQAQF